VPLVFTPPASWLARTDTAPLAHWPDPVQHVDVLPTVADLAGIPVPGDLAGRSLRDHAAGRVPVAERWALSEAAGGRSAALRLGRFKYIHDPRDPLQQLYDLSTDPGERRNLAGDPAHAAGEAVVRRALLARWPQLTR
jgi:choline-sulfatase